MSDNKPQLAPGSTIGPYTIGVLLGRGRDTEVYRAYSAGIKRNVALKLYHPCAISGDDFKREIASIVSLKHPNIMRIYDYGVEGSLYYIVMELIEGMGLRDRLTLHPTGLEREETLRIFSQIASAVACAHDQNVVHGNLKPDNVLLDQHHRPVLTDFNIACLRTSGDVFRSSTPSYLAPEQAAAGRALPASDIYLLGILLYEMVTGDVPYKTRTTDNILAQHRDSPPRPPSHVAVGLDPRIERAILTALNINPADRYKSAREMLAAMEGRNESNEFETLSLTREQAQKPRAEIKRFMESRLDDSGPAEPAPAAPLASRFRLITITAAVVLVIIITAVSLIVVR